MGEILWLELRPCKQHGVPKNSEKYEEKKFRNKHLECIFLFHQYLPASSGGRAERRQLLMFRPRAQRGTGDSPPSAPPAVTHSTVNTWTGVQTEGAPILLTHTEPRFLREKRTDVPFSSVHCGLATGHIDDNTVCLSADCRGAVLLLPM